MNSLLFPKVYSIHNPFFCVSFFFFNKILILGKDVHLVYYETNLNVLLVIMKCSMLFSYNEMTLLY